MPQSSAKPIATIGYEGAPLSEVLSRMTDASVELLIDVRAVASSRRAGFSKTILSASLKDIGIGYLHLRGLGTPKAGRMAARAGRTEEMRTIFNAHMQTDTAAAALKLVIAESKQKRVCLLCFEQDWRCCHRSIVADLMHGQTGASVFHL